LFRDAVVCYAKPFSSNQGLSGKRGLRVSESFVPAELAAAHAEVIDLRYKLFAHMDIDKQAPQLSIEKRDGKSHVSFGVVGYERVHTEHLFDPLQRLSKLAHSYMLSELREIEERDA
jgi:uncharacterized ferritin-like protein (DUF455 family)